MTFEGHSDFVKAVLVHKQYLFTASVDSTIRKWDLSSGKELFVFKSHTRGVDDIAIDEDGKYLYSASSDTTIKKWDLETGDLIDTLNGHLTSVYKIIISDGCLYSGALVK
jgi:WD40 repeat protein